MDHGKEGNSKYALSGALKGLEWKYNGLIMGMKVKNKIIKKSDKLYYSSFKIIWNLKNPFSIEVYNSAS